MLDIALTTTLAFLGPIGWPELLVLAILGVLIFGKRLPEVGKSIGRGIVEFKKGLSGIDDDLNQSPPRQPPQIEKHEAHTTSAPTESDPAKQPNQSA